VLFPPGPFAPGKKKGKKMNVGGGGAVWTAELAGGFGEEKNLFSCRY